MLDSVYSTKSDVWALGIVFWEIFTSGSKPYQELSAEQTAVYIFEGGRLDKPPGCSPDIFGLMKSCWLPNQDERPSFASLYEKLKSKSSIYYTHSPVRPVSGETSSIKLPIAIASTGQAAPPNSSPADYGAGARSKTPSTPKSAGVLGKSKKTPIPESRSEEYTKEIFQAYGREDYDRRELTRVKALTVSSSESSLATQSPGAKADDLTRGDKIRKSLRKLVGGNKQKRKTKLDELNQAMATNPSVYYG